MFTIKSRIIGTDSLEKIYFVPLYDYLSVPDFNKILHAIDSSTLKDFYEIKLMDMQTDQSIVNANSRFNIKLPDYLLEPSPFALNLKKKTPSPIKLTFEQKIDRWRDIMQSYRDVRKHTLVHFFRKNNFLRKAKHPFLISTLKYTVHLSYLLLFLVYKILLFCVKITRKTKRGIKNSVLPGVTVKGSYALFHEIYNFLKYQKPKCLIVSSDLANVNIRMAIASAKLLKIPVIVFWMGDIEKKRGSVSKEAMNRFLIKIEPLFPYQISYFRALVFNENFLNIFGYYACDATLFVSNSIAKEKLLIAGIKAEKIKIVAFKENAVIHKEELSGLHYKKFIVFYTENLKSIYGEKYIVTLHKFLGELFSKLYKEYGIHFVIRPHPRERTGELYDTFIQECFSEEGIIIDKELPIEYLMENALLNIAHFSKVLLDSIVMGKSILSINILQDNRTFIPEKRYRFIEAQSFDDIRNILQKFLQNGGAWDEFRAEYENLHTWLLNGAEPFENAFQQVLNRKVK